MDSSYHRESLDGYYRSRLFLKLEQVRVNTVGAFRKRNHKIVTHIYKLAQSYFTVLKTKTPRKYRGAMLVDKKSAGVSHSEMNLNKKAF